MQDSADLVRIASHAERQHKKLNYCNGHLGAAQPLLKVVIEEEAGSVPVTIANTDAGHPL